MPKSSKPRKAYRQKYPKGQLPITIRHSASADRMLQMVPQQDLERFRTGDADEYTINTLTLRLNWGYVMSGEVFDNPEVLEVMELGLAAIRSVKARFERIGKCGATGQEFHAIGLALNHTDEMQKAATRREQRDALDLVNLINNLKQKGDL